MSEEKKEKRCCGCKTPKPLDNFYKHKKQSDGHSPYCIECTRENSKRYFQRKKEKQVKNGLKHSWFIIIQKQENF